MNKEQLPELRKICENPENSIKDKYTFTYLIIKKEYLDAANINQTLPFGVNSAYYNMAPKNKNITHVEFAMVRIGDIKIKKFNPARANAIDENTISGIEQVISTGAYCGWKYIPPVINENGELIAGYHRYEGHKGVWGLDGYIWVAICKFKDDAAEFDYNEKENQISLEFDKKYSSYEDILSSTRYGLQKKYYTLEDMPARVNQQRLKPSEKIRIIQTIQKENGVKVDLSKNVRRSEVFSEYENKTNKKLDFVASISVGDNALNNARFRDFIVPLSEGKDQNIGISIKDTKNLKHLNEERDRLIKELSVPFINDNYKKFTDSVDSGKVGKLTISFKDQYENDEWKLDIGTENVKN